MYVGQVVQRIINDIVVVNDDVNAKNPRQLLKGILHAVGSARTREEEQELNLDAVVRTIFRKRLAGLCSVLGKFGRSPCPLR